MKREAQEKQKRGGSFKPPTDKFWAAYPHLAQVLSDQWWDDGAPRDCPQLSIRLYVDSVQLSIVDIGERRSTATTAPTLAEGLGLLEAICAQGALPWRSWGNSRKK